jgi:hypothetical protein
MLTHTSQPSGNIKNDWSYTSIKPNTLSWHVQQHLYLYQCFILSQFNFMFVCTLRIIAQRHHISAVFQVLSMFKITIWGTLVLNYNIPSHTIKIL